MLEKKSFQGEYSLPLKNKSKILLLDKLGYEAILNNKYFQAINLTENLREHSHGYAFFQRFKSIRGINTSETIYLHKYIAETFINKPLVKSGKKVFVHFKNNNPLDCRIENLEWLTMNELRRKQKSRSNESGYRGVVTEGVKRYKAIIYNENTPIVIGVFTTALAAAKAYNKKSLELFGSTASLNDLYSKIK